MDGVMVGQTTENQADINIPASSLSKELNQGRH